MTPAATDVRSRRRAQTRGEIIEAAWELAEGHGISGLSLRELASEVGMQAPSLYTYFGSKAAIYDAMFAAGYRQLDDLVQGLEADPDDPVGTLTSHIEAFVGFCLASIPRYQLLFTRAIPGWEPSSEAYAVSLASYARMTEQLSALGITDPRHLDLLSALTTGLASQQVANDPGGTRWHDLSRDAAEMYLTHVRRG
jgi:AcrR family transcriptional regulator